MVIKNVDQLNKFVKEKLEARPESYPNISGLKDKLMNVARRRLSRL